MAPNPPPKLNGIQASRAVAAILVVVFHANIFVLPSRIYFDGTQSWVGFNMGYAGVEFFFALSGFIMVLIHREDFGRRDRCWTFMRKRVERIYPVYWVVLGGLVLLYNLFPSRGPDAARDGVLVVQNFLLVPLKDLPIMQVAWTLQHEMLFYLVFAVIIVERRLGAVLFGLWMAGCFASLLLPEFPYPIKFLFSYYNTIFLFGMLAAFAYRHLSAPMPLFCLIGGSAAFVATGLVEVLGYWDWDHGVRTVLLGAFGSVAVGGVARQAAFSGWNTPRLLVFLGDASYSIYLAHLPALSFGAPVLVALGFASLPPLALLMVCVVIGTLGGVVVHLFIERPIMRVLRRLRQSTPVPT